MHLIALVFCLLFSPVALAIGDSGGCGDPLSGPLGQALKAGSATDVEREILSWVSREEKRRGTLVNVFTTESQKAQWRKLRTRELIEGVHEKDAFCRPGALLGTALQAGNLEVVRYLTGTPAGVIPKVPPGILFVCEHNYSENDEFRARRRRAFELVLQTHKVDINYQGNGGRTILQSCLEPELIDLFVAYGAPMDISLLDGAVSSAVRTEEDSTIADSLHALERAKIYARLLSYSIQGRDIEQRARQSCNRLINGKRWNQKNCKALSEFIKAEPGTFGGAIGWPQELEN